MLLSHHPIILLGTSLVVPYNSFQSRLRECTKVSQLGQLAFQYFFYKNINLLILFLRHTKIYCTKDSLILLL